MGRLSVQYQIRNIEPIIPVADINPKVPLINVLALWGNKLIGYSSDPSVRLKSGDAVAVPDLEGRFELDVTALGFLPPQRPVIVVQVPDWAVYVASKNGKNFYPVESPSGKRLAVETRVYFRTKEEALAAGFKAGSGVK